ncbi:hypothetical protein B0A48_14754 [Cryoendolithus antarcticus]|uniref:Uncharacterized protein n=1 Tax=Cryoendolithus antarcticus TaxID=1507870 RepID=A0A1V8SKF6_9PEZI|nr:hypothetical protein B0A48_14754 [Cryoendolithus antarcticus]
MLATQLRKTSKDIVFSHTLGPLRTSPDNALLLDSQQDRLDIDANLHGMRSPLELSTTRSGIDRITTGDVIALMDHLAVRDQKHNVRDNEVLAFLVRSAAELRDNYGDIQRCIDHQNVTLVRDAGSEGGQVTFHARNIGAPPPTSWPQDGLTVRQSMVRHILEKLPGGKSRSDLAMIERMLVELLDDIEVQKASMRVIAEQPQEHGEATKAKSSRMGDETACQPDTRYWRATSSAQTSDVRHSSRASVATRVDKQHNSADEDVQKGQDNHSTRKAVAQRSSKECEGVVGLRQAPQRNGISEKEQAIQITTHDRRRQRPNPDAELVPGAEAASRRI